MDGCPPLLLGGPVRSPVLRSLPECPFGDPRGCCCGRRSACQMSRARSRASARRLHLGVSQTSVSRAQPGTVSGRPRPRLRPPPQPHPRLPRTTRPGPPARSSEPGRTHGRADAPTGPWKTVDGFPQRPQPVIVFFAIQERSRPRAATSGARFRFPRFLASADSRARRTSRVSSLSMLITVGLPSNG